MKNQLHVVLGAAGGIGRATLASLAEKDIPTRAVEKSVSIDGVDTINADLLDPAETLRAVDGASHVYVCVGLPYDTKQWQHDWPLLMQNVIDACLANDAVLVFFDNIYMYGPSPLEVPFDESSRQQPNSKKGKLRKRVAEMVMDATKQKNLHVVIGRSADFYGPAARNSALYTVFLERMLDGKAPQWLGSHGVKHTYAYAPDNGRALVELALDPSTHGQVWHLPVSQPVTIEQVAEMFNTELGTDFKVSIMPKWSQKLLSLFIPAIREMQEMSYMFDDEYVMDEAKFRQHFPDFAITPLDSGIKQMVAYFHKS